MGNFSTGEEQSEVCSGECEVGKKKKGEKKTETSFGANWTRQNRTERTILVFSSFLSSLFFLLQGGGRRRGTNKTKQKKRKRKKRKKPRTRAGEGEGETVVTR